MVDIGGVKVDSAPTNVGDVAEITAEYCILNPDECEEQASNAYGTISGITLEQIYFINAWGGVNGLLAVLSIFIYIQELRFFKDEPFYSTSVAPFSSWYKTALYTFVWSSLNVTWWILQGLTEDALWQMLFTRF